MLKEIDQKIEQLETRICQLEQENKTVTDTAATNHSSAPVPLPIPKPVVQQAKVTPTPEPVKSTAAEKPDVSVTNKIKDLDKRLGELKDAASANGLEISGCFDVNANPGNPNNQTFSLGSLELDSDYVHYKHLGASIGLVLCGKSGPGALSGESTMAGMAFALVDYQNFANKDCVTLTALTTSRMQLGGNNADDIGLYGSWGIFNYSAYWTDAIDANDGHVIGGRLGLAVRQNTYRIHNTSSEGDELVVSLLSDLNNDNNIRNTVYGIDFSVGYGMLRWQNEMMRLPAHQNTHLDQDGNIDSELDGNTSPFGKGHLVSSHSTLIADLERSIKHPVPVFARFSRWVTSQNPSLDYDGSTVPIEDISMHTRGFNYKFSDLFAIKFENNHSLGTSSGERYFDEKLGNAQTVMFFVYE
jgi:hypothetical protein